jgi:hypothetical protein
MSERERERVTRLTTVNRLTRVGGRVVTNRLTRVVTRLGHTNTVE